MSTAPNQNNKEPFRSLLATFIRFAKPYRLWALSALVALIFGAGLSLSLPLMFRWLIDGGFLAGENLEQLNNAFGYLLVLVFALALASATRYYLVTTLGERITADIRSQVYQHLLVQRPTFYETLKVGEVLSRLTADTTLIQTLIGSSLSFFLRNLLTTVGGLALLIITSPSMAGAVLLVVLVVLIPVVVLAKRVRRLSRTNQDKLADSSAIAQEVLNQITTVQAFNQEDAEGSKFTIANDITYQSAKRRAKTRAALMFSAIGLAFAGLVIVLWMGATSVGEGTMTGGELAQFVMYAAIVGGGFAAMSEIFGEFQRAAGAADRLLELLNLDTTITPLTGRKPPVADGGYELLFSEVNFAYPASPEKPVLRDFTLSIPSGQTIAIVGPSGAGKSTLFNLLMRWYDASSGAISVNNTPLEEIDVRKWRASCAYVAQDAVIFSGTLRTNVTYGYEKADNERVSQALEDAAAIQFVKRLEKGLDTEVGEKGVRLSGGERQRISLARAILKDAGLLLLDEATASLDAESERLVQLAIERSRKGRTTLVIAHRLATVMAADRIVVMDQGQIVETGKHAELMAKKGLYAKLAALQFIDENASKSYENDDMTAIKTT